MALVCPSCGTENRLAARFCIECVLPLPVDFAPTQQLPLRAGTPSADELPEALAAFAAGPVSTPAAPLADTAFHPPAAEHVASRPGKLRAFLVLTAGFALAAAAGWFVASSEDAPPGGTVAKVAATVAPATVEATAAAVAAATSATTESAATAAVATTVPTGTTATAATTEMSTNEVKASEVASAVPGIAPHAASKNAPSTNVAAATPTQRPNAGPEKAATSKHAVASTGRESAGLFASCEPLNFISRSRCKVDICASAANARRPECAPVLEQQRLVEQKRNPELTY